MSGYQEMRARQKFNKALQDLLDAFGTMAWWECGPIRAQLEPRRSKG